ncbi:MAG: response regulator transcription factor [Proteobacteria bacterium]|nr:response regulator transcription factor [Pseudomonadota bacterium]
MLRVIVVDDELPAREGLRQLLAAHAGVRIVGEAAAPNDAVALIRSQRPDAVFLDIEMHTATGFDVVEELPEPPAIVFVTAHSRYAAQAYDVAAVDYLLKPVRPARLAETIARLEKRRAGPRIPRTAGPPSLLRLKSGGRTVLLRTETVIALQAEKDYTSVLAERHAPLLASQSLGELEELVPSPPFVRLDRSLVINADRIREIETIDRSCTRLRLEGYGQDFLLGRTATARLKRLQTEDR